MSGIWREPSAETKDYPNLIVHDGRVAGSITVGRSRLPLWAIIATAVEDGWSAVEQDWPQITKDYGFSAQHLGEFLNDLLEQRGEFGRLICILADVERQERGRMEKRHVASEMAWWEHRKGVERVKAQLRLCLAALE